MNWWMILERNKELPEGWIRTGLESISMIILGQSPSSSTYNKEKHGLPFFQGKAEFGEIHPTVRIWCNAPKKIAEKDDILISVRAPVGSTNISTETCCIGRGLAAIRVLEMADMMYVFYHLRHLENHISQKGTGTTFKAITGKQLRSVKLSLPPLNEQKRIVSRLESILARIDATRANLEALASKASSAQGSLAQLKSSVLKQAFEGRLVPQDPDDEPVEKLLRRIREGSKGVTFEKEDLPEGWVRTDLQNCTDILDNKRIPINLSERSKRQGKIPYYGATGQVGWIDEYIFDEELVLLGEDGAPFLDHSKNKAYLISGKSWVNNHAHVLRAISTVLSNKFLHHFLNQFNYHGFVTGTTRLKLNQSQMKTISILIPPLNEQKRIVSRLESILSGIDAKQKELQILEERLKSVPDSFYMLRSSILKQAFEGRLVPQDPNDEPASVLLEKISSKQSQKT